MEFGELELMDGIDHCVQTGTYFTKPERVKGKVEIGTIRIQKAKPDEMESGISSVFML